MDLGLGVLGLSPLVFWALTPRELQAALRGRLGILGGGETISRPEFEALMHRFPDNKG
jgi:uncharacterized phage protein (TIGR02216 family)